MDNPKLMNRRALDSEMVGSRDESLSKDLKRGARQVGTSENARGQSPIDTRARYLLVARQPCELG